MFTIGTVEFKNGFPAAGKTQWMEKRARNNFGRRGGFAGCNIRAFTLSFAAYEISRPSLFFAGDVLQ